MEGGGRVEFGMEGRCDQIALANGDGRLAEGDERFDVWSAGNDLWGADERERNRRSSVQRCLGMKTAELASVGVALDSDVKSAEMDGRVILDRLGEQDEAGTGAEGRKASGDLLAQGAEEAEFAEEFSLDGRFAARKDQPVERRVEVAALADFERTGAEFGNPPFVFDERPLKGKDADSHLPRSAMST